MTREAPRTATRRATRCRGCASTRTRCATANAYYSPDKKALLFGYFPASTQPATHRAGPHGVHLPVARHHRPRDDARPARRAAPPAPGSHEPRRASPSTRRSPTSWRCSSTSPSPSSCASRSRGRGGDLTAARLLGGLAQQFGEGTQQRRPAARLPRPERRRSSTYATTTEAARPRRDPRRRGLRRLPRHRRPAHRGPDPHRHRRHGVLPDGRAPPRPRRPPGRRGLQGGARTC